MKFAWLALIFAAVGNTATVATLIGDGKPGFSETQVNNPYGMTIGPDGALYFCDLDNQRIRRLDLKTKQVTTIAGNGEKGYTGDGGRALDASLSMPHELVFDGKGDLYIAERDNYVIRKVTMRTGIISTAAGTGKQGFSGDGGPANQAQLNQPHCVMRYGNVSLLICDVGNRRIRRLDLETGLIETWAGTGEPKPTPEGAARKDAPLNGPRTLVQGPNGDLYLTLVSGNAVYRIDSKTDKLWRVAGTGEAGYSGDGGPALDAKFGGATGGTARSAGPKGLAITPDLKLYVADTESHAIRMIDLKSGVITTVLGTGEIGDGPEPDPLRCHLHRPHSLLYVNGVLYVGDSEAHRIRTLIP